MRNENDVPLLGTKLGNLVDKIWNTVAQRVLIGILVSYGEILADKIWNTREGQ